MTHRHRLVPLAAASAALLALCGCAIGSTGPVLAGQAATGVRPGTRLYFVDRGGIRLALRDDTRREELQAALDSLVAGPDPAERRDGLSTELPAGGRVRATVTPGAVTLRLSWPTAALSAPAIQQLVCTAEDAPTDGPAPKVAIVGSEDPSAIRQQCELHRTG
ncbi:GerMN domain-containing protein [Kitasatospora sp. NPDC059795]|uniref:GerMN domain-containing protein n=1 Tax=Kitasatospora sp. NPDC059795 TaxID=3346949 RepID=UPI00365B41DC